MGRNRKRAVIEQGADLVCCRSIIVHHDGVQQSSHGVTAPLAQSGSQALYLLDRGVIVGVTQDHLCLDQGTAAEVFTEMQQKALSASP
jgi:hypothetical protein